LRRAGYPCVFYADYYGAHYVDRGRDGNNHEIWLDSHHQIINQLLYARQNFAYGDQIDYLDHPDLIGWTRMGDAEHPQKMAVILSDGAGGSKWMKVDQPLTSFKDITGHVSLSVITNADGWGEFCCNGGSVSVWVPET
jgi:alpha-amylase